MRILVYGAGPLGSLMAARLHEAGHDVAILARRQRLADIRDHGIVIQEDGADTLEVARVPAVEALEPHDEYDLVMVVMRKDQAEAIIPILAANARVSETLTYLFMMNNAEGPGRLVEALGEGRVMLGFPYPGGERDGHVMRVPPVNERKVWTIPIGEPDGEVTERTREVAAALGQMRGYKVQIRTDMDAWLKYHAALLMPAFAPALYAAEIDMERLGRTRDLLVLGTRGVREALRGLRKHAGIPPAPKPFIVFEFLPEPLWVWLFGGMMRRGFARASIEGHPKVARDELKLVADELTALLREVGAPTPTIDQLMPYYDPAMPPYPEGSRELSIRWGGMAAPLLALVAAAWLVRRWLRR